MALPSSQGDNLEIEGEPGQGTTVRLSLPRAVEDEFVAETKQESSTEAVTVTGSRSGKILVVEDDADVRALVVSQLTDLGYEIIEAEDGPAALALLEEHSEIDLLFSDVVLPGGMSGLEAVAQAHQMYPNLKVLFTSGYPEKDVELLDAGGKDLAILRKPYRKFELAEAIAAAMNSG